MVSNSSACTVALDTAGRLDRELATVATYLDDLREQLRGDARASLLVNALAHAMMTAQQLREHVLRAVVGPDEESIEIHERALRARMNIVIRGLYALKQNELWIPLDAFAVRFRVLSDVSAFMVDQLSRIHDRWQEQRGLDQLLDACARRALAYAALDEAEIALERLGRDSDLQRFLRVGGTSECEPLATACREIAATLGVHARSGERALCAPRFREECAS